MNNWEQIARESLDALRLMNAFYDDLSRSNPGYLGKLCLTDYGQMNEALLKSETVLAKYKTIKL